MDVLPTPLLVPATTMAKGAIPAGINNRCVNTLARVFESGVEWSKQGLGRYDELARLLLGSDTLLWVMSTTLHCIFGS